MVFSGVANPIAPCKGVWNPGHWNQEYGSRNLESLQRMEYDRESGMQFPEFGLRGGGIQNARLFWILLLYMGHVERLSTDIL